jgi:hypothetical protein
MLLMNVLGIVSVLPVVAKAFSRAHYVKFGKEDEKQVEA